MGKRRKFTRPEKIDRIDTFDKEEKENQENQSLQDFRAKISGGASDFYSKFKRRHRLNLKTEPSVEPSTPRAQDRSDTQEIMDIAPSYESGSFTFNMADTIGETKEDAIFDFSTSTMAQPVQEDESTE